MLEITDTLLTRLINCNACQYVATFKTFELSYTSISMALCSTDSHLSVSLKVLEGDIIWHITLRMLKCHPITAFMKIHANFKTIFLNRIIWFKFPIKF